MCECREAATRKVFESAANNSREIILVGDKSTGKTSLMYNFITDKFLGPDCCVMLQSFSKDVTIEGKTYSANFAETPTEAEYSQLRSLSYEKANAIILCFAVDSQESFKNAFGKWYIEIKKQIPSIPIVLVATKCDLKSIASPRNPVSYRAGQSAADEMGAFQFIECSAKTSEGCLDVLKAAVKATLS